MKNHRNKQFCLKCASVLMILLILLLSGCIDNDNDNETTSPDSISGVWKVSRITEDAEVITLPIIEESLSYDIFFQISDNSLLAYIEIHEPSDKRGIYYCPDYDENHHSDIDLNTTIDNSTNTSFEKNDEQLLIKMTYDSEPPDYVDVYYCDKVDEDTISSVINNCTLLNELID